MSSVTNYLHKYNKYKSKYLELRTVLGGNNVPEKEIQNVPEKEIYNISERQIRHVKLNSKNNRTFKFKINLNRFIKRTTPLKKVNIKDIEIPSSYSADSILQIANLEFINDHGFHERSKDYFNSLLEPDTKEAEKGNFIMISEKDNSKHKVNVVPFLVFDRTKNILCWPWINSIHLNILYFRDEIVDLKNRLYPYLERIPHLNFDCLELSTSKERDKVKSKEIFYDIIILTRFALRSLGYFDVFVPQLKNRNYESTEYVMIKTIEDFE